MSDTFGVCPGTMRDKRQFVDIATSTLTGGTGKLPKFKRLASCTWSPKMIRLTCIERLLDTDLDGLRQVVSSVRNVGTVFSFRFLSHVEGATWKKFKTMLTEN